MKYRTRTYYTDSQKALMWERWKDGATFHQIAQLFDRAHTSVQGILAQAVTNDLSAMSYQANVNAIGAANGNGDAIK